MTTLKAHRTAKAKAAPANIAKLRAKSANTPMAELVNVPVDQPLTEKQKAFARAYGQGESVSSALARADLSTASSSLGYRLLQQPNILAVVNAERAAFAQANDITREKVQALFVEAYDVAKLMSEPASMVAAAREMGRMAGLYEAKKTTVDINLRTGGMLKELSSASDEVLIAMIEKAAREAHALDEAKQLALGHDADGDDE